MNKKVITKTSREEIEMRRYIGPYLDFSERVDDLIKLTEKTTFKQGSKYHK